MYVPTPRHPTCHAVVILGELKRTGVVIPTTEDIYVPILEKLKEDGIQAKNHSIMT